MYDNIRTRLAFANQTRVGTSTAIVNLHGFVVGANAVVWSSLIVAYISIGGALPLLFFVGLSAPFLPGDSASMMGASWDWS